MAGSKLQKKIMNMVYGLGASVVIIGSLFKILHLDMDLGFIKIGGGTLLAIGLGTEALIFAISAFEPVQEETDWSLVFPELKGGEPRTQGLMAGAAASVPQVQQLKDEEREILKESLSQKLDAVMKEAKIDANLMSSLANSIKNFEGAAKGIAPVAEVVSSTHKYGEELSVASAHLASLNNLYLKQVQRGEMQVNAQEGFIDNLNVLNSQMNSFKDNLKNLNTIYGGMLSAMGGNK